MLGFKTAQNRRIETAFAALRQRITGDFLALSHADIVDCARQHGLGRTGTARLLAHLIKAAIDNDVHRLIDHFRASGRTTVPPARLVADWAMALGVERRKIAILARKSAAPMALAQEYLKAGRLDLPQLTVLEDVAVAYGTARETALSWIEAAVNAEIDGYVARTNPRPSWWQRWAGSQLR